MPLTLFISTNISWVTLQMGAQLEVGLLNPKYPWFLSDFNPNQKHSLLHKSQLLNLIKIRVMVHEHRQKGRVIWNRCPKWCNCAWIGWEWGPESHQQTEQHNSPPILTAVATEHTWNRTELTVISSRGGADKSLARPTPRCRRTESIVSLEKRGLFMCRIASLFLLQRLKGSMSGDARDFNYIDMRAFKFFFFLQGKTPRKFMPFLQKH